jgi:hypothetical protein
MQWWQMKKRDADLERELQADLELEEEEQRERGLSAEEARHAAGRGCGLNGAPWDRLSATHRSLILLAPNLDERVAPVSRPAGTAFNGRQTLLAATL